MLLVETYNTQGARDFMRKWCEDRGYGFESRLVKEPAWDFSRYIPKPEMISWLITGADESDVDFTGEIWLYSVWSLYF